MTACPTKEHKIWSLGLLMLGCSGAHGEIENPSTEPPVSAGAPSSAEAPASAAVVESAGSQGSSSALRDKFAAGRMCTQIACVDRLEVQGPETLELGTFKITVEADGKTSNCTLIRPGSGAVKSAPKPECQGDARVRVVPGTRFEGGERSFALLFDGAPAAVKITVLLNQKKVADQSFSPTYQTSQPNGPDCPPSCKQAKESLAGNK